MEQLIRGSPAYFEPVGRGRPIIVLHGTPLDHRAMRAVLDPIVSGCPGWNQIYLDLPGHGKTPGADWITSNDQMVDWLAEFVNAVIPGKDFALIGESYGGYLARGLTLRLASRVSGLFLWTPAKYPRAERKRAQAAVRTRNDGLAAELTSDDERNMFGLFVHQTAEAVEFMRTYIVPAAEIADEAFLDRVVDTPFSFDLSAKPFERPTLIACGRQDAVAGYLDIFEVLDAYPRATYVLADDAGHTLGFIERRALFASLVHDWLGTL